MKKVIYILWVLLLIVVFYLFGFLQGEKQESIQENTDSIYTEVLPEEETKQIVTDDKSFPVLNKKEKKHILTDSLYSQRSTLITKTVSGVSDAVVGINVVQLKKYVRRSPFGFNDPLWQQLAPELFREREVWQKVQSLGSGFIISDDGYIVTNEHVVEDAAEIIVTTTDGEHRNAELIGIDKVSDLALLKIEGDKFPYIKFGNSDDILIGEWSIALGNPFGLFELNDKPTVTVGVVSAIDRDWGRMDNSGRVYQDMIQTDAAINHGNSGGPLVNILGECIGMNTFIYTGNSGNTGFVGIGFAIPSNKINSIIMQLKVYGEIDRDYWIGIEIKEIDNITANALGLNKTGVLIISIEEKSPAEKAGVKQDDVILGINGKAISSFKDARNILTNLGLKVGDILDLNIWRDGKQIEVKLYLEKQKTGENK
ncbi:MAG: trypsin-like peptidase domain-containing protein [Calditrichia bacterium]|nr:trypsin-like peptidase domain-containing protein [Calditrichia bacterium]